MRWGNLRHGCRISTAVAVSRGLPGCYGNAPKEYERVEYLCKRIEGEKNPHELRKLAAELNNLVSVRIESLCKRIEGEKNPSRFEELVVELNDLVSPIIKSVQP
jgi:hypothetical protein